MKFISDLTKPLSISKSKKKAVIISFDLLFTAAVIYEVCTITCPPVVRIAIAVGAALMLGAVVFFKIHRAVLYNSPFTLLLSLFVGIENMYRFKPNGVMLDDNAVFFILFTGFALLLMFFGLSALILGALTKKNGGEFHGKKFGVNLLVIGALLFTVLFFLTSETFFYNYDQLKYSFVDFAPFMLLKTVFFSLVTAVFMCTLSDKFRHLVSDLIIGILLCIYVQYMFLNKSLTKLGEDINWSELHSEMIVNAVIWAVLLILPFIVDHFLLKSEASRRISDRIQAIVPGFIGGIQLITIIVLIISNPSALNGYKAALLSGEDQFLVSRNKNIITIILDMADQYYFEKAYEKDPDAFECMKDFTYYTNTAMLYDSTYLSIPSMLTAARTFPEAPYKQWYFDICHDEPAETFYGRLHDNDYSVKVFGDFMLDYTCFEGDIDNVITVTRDDLMLNKELLYEECAEMSAYRALPLFIKQFIEISSTFGNDAVMMKKNCITNNSAFRENANIRTYDSDENCFIVQHINGFHEYNKTTGIDGTFDLLEIVDKYLTQLKKLGVYDESVIILTADHGIHYNYDNMPIWYIKSAGETHDSIQYCASPISLTDYAATILDEAGLYMEGDEELFGRPISQIPEDEKRERLVFQRPLFKVAGEKKQAPSGFSYWNGYYFTGTKADLKKHEEIDPPDYLLLSDYTG